MADIEDLRAVLRELVEQLDRGEQFYTIAVGEYWLVFYNGKAQRH